MTPVTGGHGGAAVPPTVPPAPRRAGDAGAARACSGWPPSSTGRRRGRGGRNVRKWLETHRHVGHGLRLRLHPARLVRRAHSPYLYEEVPYLISGGLLGVALVIGGGVLVRCAWSMRQVEEDRRNALAIVRSVDRLERILRSLDETGGAEQEEHSL